MPASLYKPAATLPHLSGLDGGLLQAVVDGQARLTPAQAEEIFHRMPLPTLGRYAAARASVLHGDTYRTFIIDRNINYTNVCNAKCTFCAFRRDGDEHDAYTLTYEQIHEKIAELSAIGGTQILMQGGMNPALPLDWYLDLLSGIKSKFPHIHVHAFSPPEMVEFVHFFNPPGASFADKCMWVMAKLRDAGLDSLPGGGGEIFADPVRKKIGLGKCDADSWLTVMNVAHRLGMFTSATMMFGHIEGTMDRIHHMEMVRAWQDLALVGSEQANTWARERGIELASPSRAGTVAGGHYKAFISWPFQRENTPLGRVPDWGADSAELSQEFPGDAIARAWDFGRGVGKQPAGNGQANVFDYSAMDKNAFPTAHLYGKRVRMSMASDYLRTQALSRLYIDNVFSIGSSWVTMGPHIGQLGLMYGANDMGSVMMEENVVSSAGTTYCLDEAVLCRLIRDAGFVPAQRNNTYDILRTHDGPDSPDLQVKDWSEHRARKTHQQAPRAKAGDKSGITAGNAKVNVTIGATSQK
ncbi:MAG TPA: radical SAM protein [Phycisphaerales bacterium]|nr:radical SAM protein [Phycisphaerales bacterium]